MGQLEDEELNYPNAPKDPPDEYDPLFILIGQIVVLMAGLVVLGLVVGWCCYEALYWLTH